MNDRRISPAGADETNADSWLTDERRWKLQWSLVYPAATVLPLLAIGLVAPALGGFLLLVVTVPAGLYMGIFGDDMRAEVAMDQAHFATSGSGGLPDNDHVPDSRLNSDTLVAYTSTVTLLGMGSLLTLGLIFL